MSHSVNTLVNSGPKRKRGAALRLLTQETFTHYLKSVPKPLKSWIEAHDFQAKSGQICFIPDDNSQVAEILVGVASTDDALSLGVVPKALPKMVFQLVKEQAQFEAPLALGWMLACYKYRAGEEVIDSGATLNVTPSDALEKNRIIASAICHARDLVNAPANLLGPTELADYSKALAKRFGAKYKLIQGDALLKAGYPAIHAVGRAASNPPCLVDFRWGSAKHPRVTLVGKGVCFDTGGLDIKPASGMKLMKKDMGGAALVLALAEVIMALKLPIQLRVLIPAVENSIAGNAMRPLDVLQTRSGKTVEVGNTDAEGRLILCDALFEACNEDPALLIDAATLTGAARVALGTDVPAVFSNSRELGAELVDASENTPDTLWQLPMHHAYRAKLSSSVADLNNISEGGYGGAITAALFLNEFVKSTTPWIHIDTMAYNLDASSGRPRGGEALGLFALVHWLEERYGTI